MEKNKDADFYCILPTESVETMLQSWRERIQNHRLRFCKMILDADYSLIILALMNSLIETRTLYLFI